MARTKDKAPQKDILAIRVPEAHIAELRALAQKGAATLPEYVRLVLRAHIEDKRLERQRPS